MTKLVISAASIIIGTLLFIAVFAGIAGLQGFEAIMIQTSVDGSKSLTPLAVLSLVLGLTLSLSSHLQNNNKKD